jgi:isoleucyl-tRNA synthetase
LRARHLLVCQENYHHSYPHCWRSKTPIIFRAMDQWFIRVDHEREGRKFRERALEAIDEVRWIPEWGVNRIKSAVALRPDWCISRQRSWGVPIPAFYAADGEPILDARVVRRAADQIEKHGSNLWFESSVEELWKLCRPDDWQGPEAARKSTDTLDVRGVPSCAASRSRFSATCTSRAATSIAAGFSPRCCCRSREMTRRRIARC